MPEFNRHSVGAVVSSAIGLALAFGTVIIATFGLFMIAMAKEFGWGAGQTSGLLAAAAFAQAPCSWFLGRLIDRVGVRSVVLPGIVLYGASVMALALANGSTMQIYGLFGLLGIASSTVTMLPYSKVITGWFRAKRGLMLSVYSVVAALLGAAIPQIARRLIDAYGWRAGYLGLGTLVIAIAFPALLLLCHEAERHPSATLAPRVAVETEATASRTRAASGPEMTAREARSTATYWWLVTSVALCSIAVQGVYAHMAPLLIGRGLSRATATDALSLYVLGSVGAQLLFGLLLDRSRSARIVAPALLLALGGLLLLYFGTNSALAIAGGSLMGACVGAEMSAAKFLHARYFGHRAFGELFGLQFLFIGLSAGIGPMTLGALRDRTGDYRAGLLLSAALLAASLLIFLFLPRFGRKSATSGGSVNSSSQSDGQAAAAIGGVRV